MSILQMSCCCIPPEPDPPLPPWVDPDGPGGPGGPQPPSNPNDTPRCCVGNTICSPNGTEPIEIGMRVVGTIKNTYEYGSGPNAGTPFVYEESFNEVFTDVGNTSACEISDSRLFTVTVPYVSENSDGTPVDRDIEIRVDGALWDRERGFFGNSGDDGDDPETDIFSGITLTIGGGGGAIRGTSNNGYSFVWRVARSETPTDPIVARPDTYRLSIPPVLTLAQGTQAASSPYSSCLNIVVAEFSDTFNVGPGSGDSNQIEILFRFYVYVSRVGVCAPT